MFISWTPNTAPGLAFQFIGIGLIGDGLRGLVPAIRSWRWLSTNGTVVISAPYSGPIPVSWGRGSMLLWDPGVSYEFTVRGLVHRSDRISYRGHWPSAGGAQRVARRYPVGKRVTVWYDPKDPERCVLQRGFGLANCFEMALGVFLAVVGYMMNPPHLGAA